MARVMAGRRAYIRMQPAKDTNRADSAARVLQGLVWHEQTMQALAEAARFNALAGSAAPPAQPAAPPARDGVASELERLAALHSSGALDDEEFRQAKTLIIGG